jgi:hypothetical protein
MTSHASTFAEPGNTAPAIERNVTPPDESDLTPVMPSGRPLAPVVPSTASLGLMDGGIVDELTNRLPTSELVKIIKGALECGRLNRPFTESDLLRAMTFGTTSAPARSAARGPRPPRG